MSTSAEYNSVKIQLLRPECEYPGNIFRHRDALYYPSKDIVFIATKQSSSHYDDDVFTEVAIWEPAEIRLLGTLTLSVPENGGWVAYYPWSFSFIPITSDLSLDDSISSCLEYVDVLLANKNESGRLSYILRSQQSLPRSDAQIENKLFDNIDPTNSLLIRGLYHLIKCPMLVRLFTDNFYFMEEAFINLQISTEAAIQIIRKSLSIQGNPYPSKKDAYAYIHANFTQHVSWVEYLEEQHEKWIETKHPLGIDGPAWAPSIFVEDILETYGTLISIYRHIILGEPGGSSDCR
jgi:hypothetical protein